MKEVLINHNDSGQRIDKFITKLMPNLPQSMLYKGLRKNCVKINGKHIKDGAFKVKEGDTVALYFKDEFFVSENPDTAFMHLMPKLDIIYEDDNILLANKKQGMSVHADEVGSCDTLIDHIKAYLYQKGEYRPNEENTFVPSLCNRIDRNTGGIVIAAKNAESLRIMNEKIKNRELEKYYLCLVHGHLKAKIGRIRAYMIKDEQKKQVYVYSAPQKDTKTMITDYRVIEEYPESSLVEAKLLTGRTHQIRASFAFIGHPLLGDGKYGTNEINKKFPFTYQALYSYKLQFTFTTPGGILDYLNGREFEVPKVEFAQRKAKRN